MPIVTYRIEYTHPNGDHWVSPTMTLKEMKEQFGDKHITESLFVAIMKKNFEKDERLKESNIFIFKTTDGLDEIIYSQIRMSGNRHIYNHVFVMQDFVKRYRNDIPNWLVNFKYKCIECGYESLFFKEEFCPLCLENKLEASTYVSINIGISIIEYLHIRYKNTIVDKYDKELRKELVDRIKRALPEVYSKEIPTEKLPKMYRDENSKYKIDKELCDELIDFYCDAFNNSSPTPQYIDVIKVRKLFGYQSYDLKLNKDLAIIFGSNGLGKTTIFKLLEIILIRPNYTSDNNYKNKINVNYLLNIPFEFIEVHFYSNDWVRISKSKDDSGKWKIDIEYSKHGFTSIMDVYDIFGANQDSFDKLHIHYNNIEKLFPNINTYSKFLFIKVNRIDNINDIRLGLGRYLIGRPGNINDDVLDEILSKSSVPSFLEDFDGKLLRISNLLNKLLHDEFHLNRTYKIYKYNLFEFLDSNEKYKQDLKTNRVPKEEYQNYHRLVEEAVLNYSKKPNSKSNNDILVEYVFKCKNTKMMREVQKLRDLYHKFLLLKKYFEEYYNELDPARKKIAFKNGKLVFLSNTSLNFDFENTLEFDSLSSGEKNIVIVLYNLIFMSTNGSIVLIDEPEVSLHTAWQMQFADIVKEISRKQQGMQVIVASHSPFITSGNGEYMVLPEFVDGDNND